MSDGVWTIEAGPGEFMMPAYKDETGKAERAAMHNPDTLMRDTAAANLDQRPRCRAAACTVFCD